MVRGIRDDALRDRLLNAYIGQKPSKRRRRRLLRATGRTVGESLTSLSPFRGNRRARPGQPAQDGEGDSDDVADASASPIPAERPVAVDRSAAGQTSEVRS
jgi:hypothetical protein